MEMFYHDTTGLFHLLVAIGSLISGTIVLSSKKGTSFHKFTGRIYAICMAGVVITSFMIFRLFGGFGIFHIAAIVSGITLLGGMIPVLTRRPRKNWLTWHFSFMYWSVMGLYAAFIAEIFTRIPETRFFGMLGISIFLVMGLASYIWKKYKKSWLKV